MEALQHRLMSMGWQVAGQWFVVGIVLLALHVVFRAFFYKRKVQQVPWDWKVFRHELLFSALTLSASAATIGMTFGILRRHGLLSFAQGDVAWYVTAGEFAVYFFAFDLYFYVIHRIMHLGPLYRLIHKTHHRSMAPNALTAFSFNPLEGILAGVFLPLFLATFEVHRSSMGWIAGFGPLMSMAVHSGHEIFPRWWYRTWATKWWLTPMFHDQHHQFFHCNYGGFTTIWDRLFGSMNPSFEDDFERVKARLEPGRDAMPLPVPTAGG